MAKKKPYRPDRSSNGQAGDSKKNSLDLSNLSELPVTYQQVLDFFSGEGNGLYHELRVETMRRIEEATGRPLICYVSRINNIDVKKMNTSIDNSDIQPFGDLIRPVTDKRIDVLFISNGGSAEAAERIVRLLRSRYEDVRFIIPYNAYSAATLICFSGNEILMDEIGTLGPVDPQIRGFPAWTILNGFENMINTIKESSKEGKEAIVLAAYASILSDYSLPLLETCRISLDLSKELASMWLKKYMFAQKENNEDNAEKAVMEEENVDQRIEKIVQRFADFSINKTHSRAIDREKAIEIGLKVKRIEEESEELANLTRSLNAQYEYWFDHTSFYKMFEDARGTHWGRMVPKKLSEPEK